MPSILFWSDLHQEFQDFDIPDISDLDARPDAVCIAGDTHTHPRHLDFAKDVHHAYGCPVLMVPGNHEYYGHNIDEARNQEVEIEAALQRLGYPIHVLRGDAVVVAGVRIIGDTLWTDFELDPVLGFMARNLAKRSMADYRHITIGPDSRLLRPADTVDIHMESKTRIFEQLAVPHDGPTVVMTHHLPIPDLISPKYFGSYLNPAFASNLTKEISGLDFAAWIYGHSHDGLEMSWEQGRSAQRFLTNPRGYPDEATRFDPHRMLHL